MQPNSPSLSTWLIIVCGAFKKSTSQTSAKTFLLKRQQLALKSWWTQLNLAKCQTKWAGIENLSTCSLVHCSPEELGVRWGGGLCLYVEGSTSQECALGNPGLGGPHPPPLLIGQSQGQPLQDGTGNPKGPGNLVGPAPLTLS